MGMVEILRGPERRRRWSVEEKLSILAEAALPGATVSGTARRHGLHPNQVFRWRRFAREEKLGTGGGFSGFVPVAIVDDGAVPAVSPGSGSGLPLGRPVGGPVGLARGRGSSGPAAGMVEVLLGNGRIMRVAEGIDPECLSRLVAALDRR